MEHRILDKEKIEKYLNFLRNLADQRVKSEYVYQRDLNYLQQEFQDFKARIAEEQVDPRFVDDLNGIVLNLKGSAFFKGRTAALKYVLLFVFLNIFAYSLFVSKRTKELKTTLLPKFIDDITRILSNIENYDLK